MYFSREDVSNGRMMNPERHSFERGKRRSVKQGIHIILIDPVSAVPFDHGFGGARTSVRPVRPGTTSPTMPAVPKHNTIHNPPTCFKSWLAL